jgi:hypothetical protein
MQHKLLNEIIKRIMTIDNIHFQKYCFMLFIITLFDTIH